MKRLNKVSSYNYEIKNDLEEIVNNYLYNKLINGLISDSKFTEDCITEIENSGLQQEIEKAIELLSQKISEAHEKAIDIYNNI